MIINFLIDSRYGGPQVIYNFLKKNINNNSSVIYLDKKYKSFSFSNFKKIYKLFYLFDIIYNFIILYLQKKYFKNFKIFFVFSIVNFLPVLFGIFLKKKIIWYIIEKPNLIFFFIFKILNNYHNLKIVCITNSLAKILKIKNYNVYFPAINENFWKKTKKSNNLLNLVAVGNLNKTKNHYQLIKYLEKTQLNYKLVIIGKKLLTQKKYYKKLICIQKKVNKIKKNNISIYLNKKHIFIKKNLNKSNIFILPSLSEGLSIALAEAMSMKLICLVSKESNHSKIIKNNINGFVFDLNYKSFKKTLIYVSKLKNKRRRKIEDSARNTIKKIIYQNRLSKKSFKNKFFLDHQSI